MDFLLAFLVNFKQNTKKITMFYQFFKFNVAQKTCNNNTVIQIFIYIKCFTKM